jgi:hypothetical protein
MMLPHPVAHAIAEAKPSQARPSAATTPANARHQPAPIRSIRSAVAAPIEASSHAPSAIVPAARPRSDGRRYASTAGELFQRGRSPRTWSAATPATAASATTVSSALVPNHAANKPASHAPVARLDRAVTAHATGLAIRARRAIAAASGVGIDGLDCARVMRCGAAGLSSAASCASRSSALATRCAGSRAIACWITASASAEIDGSSELGRAGSSCRTSAKRLSAGTLPYGGSPASM